MVKGLDMAFSILCVCAPLYAEKGGSLFSKLKDKEDGKECLRKRKADGNDYSLFR